AFAGEPQGSDPADAHGTGRAVLPDGDGVLGGAGAGQVLDGAPRRLAGAARVHAGAGRGRGAAGVLVRRLEPGPDGAARERQSDRRAALPERHRRGGHLRDVLRPGVLRATLVADDEPASAVAVQLRAAAGGRLLGGGAAAVA